MRGRRIDSLLTINKTGMPEAPNLTQLLDKDVKLLYLRDKSKNKEMYIKEVGIIYYLGDPKGPCLSAGLSRSEALQKARENFDLPTTYTPDLLVEKLIKRYHDNQTGIAGQAVEALQKAIHNITISTNIINEQLMINFNPVYLPKMLEFLLIIWIRLINVLLICLLLLLL